MTPDKPQVVLVFQGAFCQTNRLELDGIYRFAREAGWTIHTVEYDTAAESRQNRRVRRDAFDVKPLLAFWKPLGCIVECSGLSPKFELADFGRTPTVFLDRHPATISKTAICVSSNAASIAECAARELLPLGLSDYAYVPWPTRTLWSVERGDLFAQHVRMNGKSLHVFDGRAKSADTLAYRTELSAWVRALPKPCAVFAANDYLADRVVSACAVNGIAVPDDVVVLGVDDETQICENAKPTLSSIRTDNERAGYLAASLLAERVSFPSHARVASRQFGALGITRRASTRRFPDGDVRVRKALEYIRRYACEGIEPPDVVSEMGYSRRLADLRFRQLTGRTILDEIHAVRLQRVKELLRKPNVPLSSLPDFCGYASLDDLRRVFRQRAGQTLKAYRQSCP